MRARPSGEQMIEDVKCPECGGPMVSRKNGKTGQLFWGCKQDEIDVWDSLLDNPVAPRSAGPPQEKAE